MNLSTCTCESPRWMQLTRESTDNRYNILLDGVKQLDTYDPDSEVGELVFIEFNLCTICFKEEGKFTVKGDEKQLIEEI